MNWPNHRKKRHKLFHSSKSLLTEAETVASNCSTDLPSLDIRRGDLPILVHFSLPPREYQQFPCFWKFFRRSPPCLKYFAILRLSLCFAAVYSKIFLKRSFLSGIECNRVQEIITYFQTARRQDKTIIFFLLFYFE